MELCQAAATAGRDGPCPLIAFQEARLTKLEGYSAGPTVGPHKQPEEEVDHREGA